MSNKISNILYCLTPIRLLSLKNFLYFKTLNQGKCHYHIIRLNLIFLLPSL